MDQQTIDAYDKIALDYQQRNSVSMWEHEYQLFQKLTGPNKSVLDIGCGIGRDSDPLCKLGFNYTGIDASSGMLKIAKQNYPNCRFIQGDFYALPFSDMTFDSFWAAASFLHVPKLELPKVLQEARRITKNNGFGMVSVKEMAGFNEGFITEPKAGGIQRYFAFYSEPEMKSLLEANDFTVHDITRTIENDDRKTVWLSFFVQKTH